MGLIRFLFRTPTYITIGLCGGVEIAQGNSPLSYIPYSMLYAYDFISKSDGSQQKMQLKIGAFSQIASFSRITGFDSPAFHCYLLKKICEELQLRYDFVGFKKGQRNWQPVPADPRLLASSFSSSASRLDSMTAANSSVLSHASDGQFFGDNSSSSSSTNLHQKASQKLLLSGLNGRNSVSHEELMQMQYRTYLKNDADQSFLIKLVDLVHYLMTRLDPIFDEEGVLEEVLGVLSLILLHITELEGFDSLFEAALTAIERFENRLGVGVSSSNGFAIGGSNGIFPGSNSATGSEGSNSLQNLRGRHPHFHASKGGFSSSSFSSSTSGSPSSSSSSSLGYSLNDGLMPGDFRYLDPSGGMLDEIVLGDMQKLRAALFFTHLALIESHRLFHWEKLVSLRKEKARRELDGGLAREIAYRPPRLMFAGLLGGNLPSSPRRSEPSFKSGGFGGGGDASGGSSYPSMMEQHDSDSSQNKGFINASSLIPASLSGNSSLSSFWINEGDSGRGNQQRFASNSGEKLMSGTSGWLLNSFVPFSYLFGGSNKNESNEKGFLLSNLLDTILPTHTSEDGSFDIIRTLDTPPSAGVVGGDYKGFFSTDSSSNQPESLSQLFSRIYASSKTGSSILTGRGPAAMCAPNTHVINDAAIPTLPDEPIKALQELLRKGVSEGKAFFFERLMMTWRSLMRSLDQTLLEYRHELQRRPIVGTTMINFGDPSSRSCYEANERLKNIDKVRQLIEGLWRHLGEKDIKKAVQTITSEKRLQRLRKHWIMNPYTEEAALPSSRKKMGNHRVFSAGSSSISMDEGDGSSWWHWLHTLSELKQEESFDAAADMGAFLGGSIGECSGCLPLNTMVDGEISSNNFLSKKRSLDVLLSTIPVIHHKLLTGRSSESIDQAIAKRFNEDSAEKNTNGGNSLSQEPQREPLAHTQQNSPPNTTLKRSLLGQKVVASDASTQSSQLLLESIVQPGGIPQAAYSIPESSPASFPSYPTNNTPLGNENPSTTHPHNPSYLARLYPPRNFPSSQKSAASIGKLLEDCVSLNSACRVLINDYFVLSEKNIMARVTHTHGDHSSTGDINSREATSHNKLSSNDCSLNFSDNNSLYSIKSHSQSKRGGIFAAFNFFSNEKSYAPYCFDGSNLVPLSRLMEEVLISEKDTPSSLWMRGYRRFLRLLGLSSVRDLFRLRSYSLASGGASGTARGDQGEGGFADASFSTSKGMNGGVSANERGGFFPVSSSGGWFSTLFGGGGGGGEPMQEQAYNGGGISAPMGVLLAAVGTAALLWVWNPQYFVDPCGSLSSSASWMFSWVNAAFYRPFQRFFPSSSSRAHDEAPLIIGDPAATGWGNTHLQHYSHPPHLRGMLLPGDYHQHYVKAAAAAAAEGAAFMPPTMLGGEGVGGGGFLPAEASYLYNGNGDGISGCTDFDGGMAGYLLMTGLLPSLAFVTGQAGGRNTSSSLYSPSGESYFPPTLSGLPNADGYASKGSSYRVVPSSTVQEVMSHTHNSNNSLASHQFRGYYDGDEASVENAGLPYMPPIISGVKTAFQGGGSSYFYQGGARSSSHSASTHTPPPPDASEAASPPTHSIPPANYHASQGFQSNRIISGEFMANASLPQVSDGDLSPGFQHLSDAANRSDTFKRLILQLNASLGPEEANQSSFFTPMRQSSRDEEGGGGIRSSSSNYYNYSDNHISQFSREDGESSFNPSLGPTARGNVSLNYGDSKSSPQYSVFGKSQNPPSTGSINSSEQGGGGITSQNSWVSSAFDGIGEGFSHSGGGSSDRTSWLPPHRRSGLNGGVWGRHHDFGLFGGGSYHPPHSRDTFSHYNRDFSEYSPSRAAPTPNEFSR